MGFLGLRVLCKRLLHKNSSFRFLSTYCNEDHLWDDDLVRDDPRLYPSDNAKVPAGHGSPPHECLTEFCMGQDNSTWVVVMKTPKVAVAKENLMNAFMTVLAGVIGSKEAADNRIYRLHYKHFLGFGCRLTSKEADKMDGGRGVLSIIPDSFLDLESKLRGGVPVSEITSNEEHEEHDLIMHPRSTLPRIFLDKRFLMKGAGGGLLANSDSAKPITSPEEEIKKKLVVLGSGWAGTSFLKKLTNSEYHVEKNVHFSEAECLSIDLVNRKVICKSTQTVDTNGEADFSVIYDYLVISVGSLLNTFNIPGVEENAYFFKEVEDAPMIRRLIIDCFDKASPSTLSDEDKKKQLHFVIVGGCPTGVVFAAELHHFICEDLVTLYPKVMELVKITLLEATDHFMNVFDKRITAFAEENFHRDGIYLKNGSAVTEVTDKEITTKSLKNGGELTSMPYGMMFWCTGIGTRPVIMDLMKQAGQAIRRTLGTDEWLRVEGTERIYALGDCATIVHHKLIEDIENKSKKADKDAKGDTSEESVELNIDYLRSALKDINGQMKNLPESSQVAAQQGAYLANCFNRMEASEHSRECPDRMFKPFRFRNRKLTKFSPAGTLTSTSTSKGPFKFGEISVTFGDGIPIGDESPSTDTVFRSRRITCDCSYESEEPDYCVIGSCVWEDHILMNVVLRWIWALDINHGEILGILQSATTALVRNIEKPLICTDSRTAIEDLEKLSKGINPEKPYMHDLERCFQLLQRVNATLVYIPSPSNKHTREEDISNAVVDRFLKIYKYEKPDMVQKTYAKLLEYDLVKIN